MKALIQRVSKASVSVDGKTVSSIPHGLCVFLGVEKHDTEKDADYLVKKISDMRIFENGQGKMDLDVKAVGGHVLVVSQFTLCASCKKGKRPDFTQAAPPEPATRLYEYFAQSMSALPVPTVTGIFGAYMQVDILNDGPVTIWVESPK